MTGGTSDRLNKTIAEVSPRRLPDMFHPALTAIIAVNVIMFVVLVSESLVSPRQIIGGSLSLESSATALVARPWTIISYAFVQGNALQLVFNMLWLFCFGRLLLLKSSPSRFVLLYFAGAVTGGVFYIAFYSMFGGNAEGSLMGSSAAVISVAAAVAVIMPDTEVYLPLLGHTKIKWIAVVAMVLFCIGLSAPNAGGNLAHIGGAVAGAATGYCFRRSESQHKKTDKTEYTRLVDKIKRSGYLSLSAQEKRRFFELSNKYQR